MTLSEMSLPIDIPWKRMGVSKDMIDVKQGDLTYPTKWRSSIAAFYHEPDVADLPPEYCDRRITYVKLVCTITNYQFPVELSQEKSKQLYKSYISERGKTWAEYKLNLHREADANTADADVSVLPYMRERFAGFAAWKDFEGRLTDSYPCYGALIQVGVYPHSDNEVELQDYPYIVSFEPRKREMMELVSRSGEVLSQSASQLNITKGTTSTDSTEDYDLKLGGQKGVSLGVLGTWGGTPSQMQEGTVAREQTQNQNLRSTDASRERREAFSFSSSVSQIYSLLQGFHLGTNRALFFLQPRPHIQDTKFTFIRGLRRLEGIQEFVLVINRPKAVPGVCIEVALETAHLYLERSFRPRIVPVAQIYTNSGMESTPAAMGFDENDPLVKRYQEAVLVWNTHPDMTLRRIAGVVAQHGLTPEEIGQDNYSYLHFVALPNSLSWEEFESMVMVAGLVEGVGMDDVALTMEEYEEDSGSFFVTGRRLCSCLQSNVQAEDGVEGEGEEDEDEDDVDSIGEDDGEEDEDEDDVDSIGEDDGEEQTPSTAACEHSTAEHLSDCDTEATVVYEQKFIQPSNPFPASPQLQVRRENRRNIQVAKMMETSLVSSDRLPYGSLSFLSTDFGLDEMAFLVQQLRHAGARLPVETEPKGIHTRENDEAMRLRAALAGTAEVAKLMRVGRQKALELRFEVLLEALNQMNTDGAERLRRIRGPNRLIGAVRDEGTLKRFLKSAGVPDDEAKKARAVKASDLDRWLTKVSGRLSKTK